ncbi:unnamed protein product [Acanthoscelides obtectus]|uniref:Mitochondrial uncoupling protein 4 n=1 Tax=Acanthoscelides obtectus TaxID=200917 RepID=A0A9P0M209_ACAOB|nr:unnamed protein product [Acanthoscelides obtectus]CAK1650422.1 Mitochondrial uncoupling protein 4 [Acanthoscelides obtectus]
MIQKKNVHGYVEKFSETKESLGYEAHGHEIYKAFSRFYRNPRMGPQRGFVQTTVGVVREEGFFKLWKGMSAAWLRQFLYSGVRIVSYKYIKNKLIAVNPPEKGSQFPIWKSAMCGATAGGFAQWIASPADLVKVQLMMEGKRQMMGLPPRVNGIMDAFIKTWNSGGVRALWKGAVPCVQRAALVNLGDLTAYDSTKRALLKHTSLPDALLVHFLASSVAGFFAALLGTPADVIKTRVMNQPFDEKGSGILYKNSLECLKKTVGEEGFAALYKGFLPIYLRMAPWSVTFWITFEQAMVMLGQDTW